MTGNEIRTALRKGDPVIATLVVSESPHWLSMIEDLGLDFVFVDTEHIPIDRSALAWMCRAYASRGLSPMVRIPSPDPILACTALDGGAAGIVAPYVETVDQVLDLVGAVKFKPLKGERLRSALEGSDSTLEPELSHYLETRNADHFLLVNIESRPALENLDDILSVEQLDGVLVGPHDLSCSLGVPEDYEHPAFLAAIDSIIAKSRHYGKGVGVHTISPSLRKRESDWASKGANLFVHSADIIAASEKLAEDLHRLRMSLGIGTGSGSASEISI